MTHVIRYATEDELAGTPAVRFACACGDTFGDLAKAAKHLRGTCPEGPNCPACAVERL